MKLKNFLTSLVLTAIFSATSIMAQPQERVSPEDRIAAEKKLLTEKITDLSDDQKIVIDEIYAGILSKSKEIIANRDPENRAATREQLGDLRTEKDTLMKDVLSEAQFAKYQLMLKENRPQRSNNQQRPNQENRTRPQ